MCGTKPLADRFIRGHRTPSEAQNTLLRSERNRIKALLGGSPRDILKWGFLGGWGEGGLG